jgi:hypothetical protein
MFELVNEPAHNFENLVSFSSHNKAASDIKRIAADLIFFVMSILLDKPMLLQRQKDPQR